MAGPDGELGLNQTSVRCLAAKGYQDTETYQPDSRYWPLMLKLIIGS